MQRSYELLCTRRLCDPSSPYTITGFTAFRLYVPDTIDLVILHARTRRSVAFWGNTSTSAANKRNGGSTTEMKTSLPYSGTVWISELLKNRTEYRAICLLSNPRVCQAKKGVSNLPVEITTTALHPFCVLFEKSKFGKGFPTPILCWLACYPSCFFGKPEPWWSRKFTSNEPPHQCLYLLNCVFWGVLLHFDSHCTKSTSGVDLKHDPIWPLTDTPRVQLSIASGEGE